MIILIMLTKTRITFKFWILVLNKGQPDSLEIQVQENIRKQGGVFAFTGVNSVNW